MVCDILSKRLEESRNKGLFRSLRTVDGIGAHVTIDAREFLLLCSNNYLGLAGDPVLCSAAEVAARLCGVSSGASRLVCGTLPLHEALEKEIAEWKGAEAALLFNSGYAANTGIIAAIAGRGDLIFSDRLNHASIIDGAILSGARLIRYPHNDLEGLSSLLHKHQTHGVRLIVTDGVFSMDGDMASLPGLVSLAREHDALLMVDDAHGGGIFGVEGRGTPDMQGVANGIDIHMGTFGKALGSFGAYAATSSFLRDYLVNRARSLIFSTSLPPAVLAASLAAISLVRSEAGRALREKLASNIRVFRTALRDGGLEVPEGITPIVPVNVGDPQVASRFSVTLMDERLFVQAIRPPTVPAGTSRLRCTVMASHDGAELESAAQTICRTAKGLGLI